jgi:hypothetical protein
MNCVLRSLKSEKFVPGIAMLRHGASLPSSELCVLGDLLLNLHSDNLLFGIWNSFVIRFRTLARIESGGQHPDKWRTERGQTQTSSG